jgi:hypothetical protein
MSHTDYKKEQDMLCAMVATHEDIPLRAITIPRETTSRAIDTEQYKPVARGIEEYD